MRTKANQRLLERLNRQAIFVTFEDTSWVNEPCDSAEAEYFGRVISLSFPNSKKTDGVDLFHTFQLKLYSIEQDGTYTDRNFGLFRKDFKSLTEVLSVVNAYISSRPFTILKQGRGKYQLLDPDGFDYTGEYLSLADAKSTSRNNYILK